jgi:signal transduction histidine kinase
LRALLRFTEPRAAIAESGVNAARRRFGRREFLGAADFRWFARKSYLESRHRSRRDDWCAGRMLGSGFTMTAGNSKQRTSRPLKEPKVAAAEFEHNLQRLDQLANLGLIAAGVAHEIKNGLVPISTFVELLLEKGQGGDEGLSETVRQELRRINTLVTQMLRLSAPLPALATAVHVHELLDYAIRLLQHQMKVKLIKLHRDYRAATDTVRGDASQLQQAFMNLLLNASEAMGMNGELTVATEVATGEPGTRWIKIQIRDTGMGVPQENLVRLFEPFFTTKKNGTGLGLAICQRIVQEHQGTVTAQSEVNRGSTFSISLPLV